MTKVNTLLFTEEEKKKWGVGKWANEPDMVSWIDEGTKLPCLIIRNSMGSLCGYVGSMVTSPFYGKNYEEESLRGIAVHGGLTFAGNFTGFGEDVNPEIWWLGFDCAHAGDLTPSIAHHLKSIPGMRAGVGGFEGDEYRDIDYVAREVEELASQLALLIIENTNLLS